MNDQIKNSIKKAVKLATPKGWKISTKYNRHSDSIVCTILQMPKSDFQALGHQASHKDVIRQQCDIKYDYWAEQVFNKIVFEDFANDEVNLNFFIPAHKNGVPYNCEPFRERFAINKPRTPKQEEMAGKILALVNAMACENWNNSDIYQDCFDTGYGMELNFGSDRKPCQLI